MPEPLNFTSDADRAKWIIEHADYFTLIHRRNLHNERWEYPTLQKARAGARARLRKDPTKRFLIYAVKGVNDTYVETVAKP